MLIDKELIAEAKEKLGDRNWEIMMDNYGIGDWDRKDMKCCCPYHHEDTPSFVYNKRKYYAKCFGGSCGVNKDIIDSFMDAKGMTYIEAVKQLFELAGIQYSFGEHGQKITADTHYVYPTLPAGYDRTQAEEYWGKRCISKDTLDVLGIVADEHGNTVFPTYDLNDVLKVVKYRPSRRIDKAKGESKCWFQKGASKEDLLWNCNRINTSEPLCITEGEADLMSAYEAGWHNVVTPLNGAGSFGWVAHMWEFLEQFDSIIICSDNDAAGEHMRKELVFRLGSWRCKVVDVPTHAEYNGKRYICNDLNDMLIMCGKEAVYKAINEAKDTPVKSVEDFATVTEVELSQMDGVETGLEAVDEELYKLYYGTVTLISGRPTSGKSSLTNSIIANAIDQNIPCWLYSGEMPNFVIKNWIDLQLCGARNIVKYTDAKGRLYNNVNPVARKTIDEKYRGLLYLYKDNEESTEDVLLNSMTECVRKFGCHLLVLDNLMTIGLAPADSDLTAQGNFMKRLTGFAIKYNVAVVLVAHPRKRGQQDPTTADIALDDIAGSSQLGNLAHRSISLRRISKAEKEKGESKFSKYDVKLTVSKDRLLGRSADTAVGIYYDVPTRRFFTNYAEYSRQYKWDTNNYQDKLPVPQVLSGENDTEIFGSFS